MFMHYVQALIVCQNTDKLNVDKTSISSFPTLDLYPKADKGGPLLGLSGGGIAPLGIPASKKIRKNSKVLFHLYYPES